MSKSVRVLLIEDQPEVVRMVGDVLAQAERGAFFVESVSRVGDGVRRLSAGGIDLVLLDLALPDSTGLDTFHEIFKAGPEIPIVVLTGLDDEEMGLLALREGAQDYVLKGEISPRFLVRTIRFAIERKHGEEARARLAAIVESSGDAIISLSLEGLIVSWNVGAQNLLGHPIEDVVGRPFGFLFAPSRHEQVTALVSRINAGEGTKDFEGLLIDALGHEVPVTIGLSPIRNAVGRIIGASMIARDIGDRKRQEERNQELIGELRDALTKLKTLSGLLPICAGCKRIRDDHGYWTQVELYVMAHSQAEFTHGICPDCEAQYRQRMGLNFKSGDE
jgi:PAS domain S-box-containing protein